MYYRKCSVPLLLFENVRIPLKEVNSAFFVKLHLLIYSYFHCFTVSINNLITAP